MKKDHKIIASEVLFELATLTRHCFNYQQITKLIMDKLSQVIDYTVCILFLFDEGEMIINVKHNSSREFLLHAKEAALEKITAYNKKGQYDLNKIKSIIYESPEALMEDTVSPDEVQSTIIAPLIIREKNHGVLLLAHHQSHHYTDEDQSLFNILTNHAAILIDNVILYSHAEQRMIELSVLHEVGKALSSILNLEELLELITSKSAELVKAERVSLMFINEKKQSLFIKSALGVAKEIMETTEQPLDKGIAGMVVRKAKMLASSNIDSDKSLGKIKSGAMYKTNSFVSLPIIIRDKVVGVLNVSEKTSGGSFSDEDANLLDTFLTQASTAVENAILYHNMEQLAVTDGLTLVYNHRYFQERLEKEVRRSDRYHLMLSLMMLDVDYFKKYNDTYGHPKGDIVLKEITNILRESVRDIDIVARYGGEEFVVILPETTHRDAILVAERIRKTVEAHKFAGKTAKETTKLTVSIGLTTYPSAKAKTRAEMIEQVDNALYRAKNSGRNQVCAVEII